MSLPWSSRAASLLLLVVAVAAIRLAALPLRGTEDVLTWKIWMIAASKNVATVYGVGGQPPVRGELHWLHHTTTVDYPPFALYELGAAGVVYRLFDPELADRPAITAAVKIPGLFFGIALTALLWWTVRRFTGEERQGRWVAVAYWVNPATVMNAEVLGYLDPLMMLPAIASLVLVHLGAPAWAGASLAVAMLTKPQALLVLPILMLAAWRTCGGRGAIEAAVGGAVTASLIFLPYALDWRAAKRLAGVRLVLRETRHPVGICRQYLVDRQLRAARVVPGSTSGNSRGVPGTGPPHHVHLHVP